MLARRQPQWAVDSSCLLFPNTTLCGSQQRTIETKEKLYRTLSKFIYIEMSKPSSTKQAHREQMHSACLTKTFWLKNKLIKKSVISYFSPHIVGTELLYQHDLLEPEVIGSMCAWTRRNWSDLHGGRLEGVVPAFPQMPNNLGVFKCDGAVWRVHAGGVHRVAVVVPESTEIILSTVFVPLVLVFVKGCELHVVVVRQTVPYK